MTKLNLIRFVLTFFTAAVLLSGCIKPPVEDRNAEIKDAASSSEKTEAAATDSEAAKIDSAVTDAAHELIPEALREFTTLPKDRSAKSLAAYLESLDGPEFQAAAISVMQSQDENARAGLQVAAQILQENKQTAADMILDAEDATEDEFILALAVQMESQIMNAERTQASPESVALQLDTLRDKVAKGRFPKLADRVDLVKETLNLTSKANTLMTGGEPKAEELDSFYDAYIAQLDKVLAQKLDQFHVFSLLQLSSVFQSDPNKTLAIYEKFQAALEKDPVDSLKPLASRLPQQIETLKKDIELQATTPEQVKEKIAKFKAFPEEKTPAKMVEYLKLLESPEFQETMQSFLEVKKEEVQKTVLDEWKDVEKNAEEATKEIFEAENATEEEYKTAFEWRLRLAMAYAADEEKPSFAQMEERYTVLKDEVEKGKFPQFAPRAAVCAQAAAILEKAAPIFEGTTQPTPEQKDALYPDLLQLAEDAVKNDALESLPLEVLVQSVGMFQDDKEKAKPILEKLINGLEGKEDENSKMFLNALKMRLQMIENPEMAQSAQNGQNPQAAPAQQELTAEQIDELKTKLEAYTKLPEEKTAAALEAFVNSVDSPEFQQIAMPLFQKQDPELQSWLTETMNKLQDTVKEALDLLCKAEDATEDQYKDALRFRLDLMRADKARKNIEPDYAALTDEVKAGRFPDLVSLVELESTTVSLMEKAGKMFSGAEDPTAEQKDELYAEFLPFVEKACAAGELKGPQLQAIMQLASIFSDDNQKMKEICEALLKGLEGKDDPQSEQLRAMLQKQLDDIKFVTEPMTFTAPEGTDLKGLKELVSQKMEIIMRAGTKDLPTEKLAEFLAAVEKFGNEDLTAYTSWQIDLIHLIPLIQSADFDINTFKEKFLACVKTGTEKNLFNINCLQMCVQMAAISSQKPGVKSTDEGKAAIEEMLNAILPVCDSLEVTGREEELKGQFRKSIESFLKELKEAPEEVAPDALNAATQAIPALPEANPNAETDALPAEIDLDDSPIEAPKADEAPKAEEATPSESTAGTEDDEDEELEEDDLEEDDLEEDDPKADEAPKVEIPEPILKMISLPENPTLEQCVEFLSLRDSDEFQDLVMQILQSGNQGLLMAIMGKMEGDTVTACRQILISPNVKKADLEIAVNILLAKLHSETEDDADAFSAGLADLKKSLKKGPFPELTKILETAKAWYAFKTKLDALEDEDEPTDEQLDALFQEYKTILPTAFASDSWKSYASYTCRECFDVFQQDEAKLLEIAKLVLKNAEGKEGEDWDDLRNEMQVVIDKIEMKTKPIQFTAKEGATLEDLKASVDEKIQTILELPDPAVALKKFDELKAAVTTVKNEDLNAYTAWETGIFTFFFEIMESTQIEDGDDDDETEKPKAEKPDVMKTLNALIDEAAKVKPTEHSFLMLTQVTLSLMQAEEDAKPEAQAELLTKLQEVAKVTDFENSAQFIAVLESQKERILNPDADEKDDEEEEKTEVSTDFVPADGASLDEMKAQASKQISTLANSNGDVPAKLDAFEASVKKVGNEELSACVNWELGIFRFLFGLREAKERPDLDTLVTKLTEIAARGVELKAFQDDSLQLLFRLSMNVAPNTNDPEVGKKLLTTMKAALAASKAPWASMAGSEIDGILVKLNLPGNPIELTAETLDGKTVKIEDFAGKTVLIDVWATWCGPCVGEIPNIRKAWDAYHDAGFEVIGLSIDDDLKELKSFLKKNDVPWTIVTQQKMKGEKFDDKYGISAIPAMFLVGADGKVITINARGQLMELLAKIYPNVEVPEDEDADEDEDEDEDDEDEGKKVSTDFVPEDGASLDELKVQAHKQIMALINANGLNLDKMDAFEASVKKAGNAELDACVNWELGIYRYILKLVSEDGLDMNEMAAKFTQIINKGVELKALQEGSLRELVQIGINLAPDAEDPEISKGLLNALKAALAASEVTWAEPAGKRIDGILVKLSLPGNPIVLTAETLDGETVKIEDFAGKTVLIDVWATWCGPCRAETPNIRKAWDVYHEAGFEVIGLSLDKDLDELKSFVEKNDIPWTIVTQQKMEGVKFDEQYAITGIPTMFLVGADGKVITINARGKLMELLGKIYPDVKVPEEKEADETDSDSQAGIEKKNKDSVTESESMAGTEDEDEEDADAPEEAKPEEISTDFVPPEDATPEALRDAVYVQFMQLVQSAKGNPFEPVLKFQKSVNAQGNADLTEFLDWNVETLRFLTVKIRTATDIQALADELAELLTKGTKIKALRPEFLSPLTQLSVQLISNLDPPAAKKLAAAVQNALASSDQPWAARASKMIQGILTQMDLPGKPLDLVAKTLDGKEIKIQDFAGKTVLVDVWATWCGPCRAEFPRMAKAYEAFHDAGFEIIGLSVDKDLEKLKGFVEEEKTPWIIATQDGMDLPESFSEKYGIMGIPTMFLVGADGKVLTTNARGRLMQLLGEIYPEAAEAARKKAEEETRLDAPADSATPSQSMSTTEEEAEENAEEAAQEQAEKPASEANILEQFSTLPKDPGLAATKEFLESFDQHAYEIQAALQQSPSMEAAMGKFQKIQDVRSQAADLIITNEQATEADLKLAADIKIQAILFTAQVQKAPNAAEKADAAFSTLIAALEARKAEALVIQVQVEQIIAGSMLLGRMPNAAEMGVTLEKLTAVCQRAKASKCMNGDLMGQFMRMIVSANDLGVEVGKIETACTALREAVLATEDPQLINTADFITGMARRAMLKGKPMELVGTTLDGQTVDIQKDYAGKVVLVDFWATWCNPCVMELKNLEDKYYAAYHEKGFEILGFSIDADRNQLAAFLERRKLPWQTICQQGDFDPVFYYGIQAIPCLILVGQDGKVIREIPTMRRDEVLSAELKKIYGD